MKNLLTLMALGCMLAVGIQAHALSITPDSGPPAALTGNQTSQAEINAAIASTLGLSIELYKENVMDGFDSGGLAGSYETLFSPLTDPSGATITYTGGNIVGETQFLLVKDGNQIPAWYLFNLTLLGWDGMETLELSNFWPAQGAISHVALYGNSTPVPEPGTLLLLGGGLLGLAVYSRRRRKV